MKEDIMPLSFFSYGGIFTDSKDNMRFMIKKERIEDEEKISLYFWPGPYRMDATKEELIENKTFVFAEEGYKEAMEYLGEKYQEKKAFWQKKPDCLEAEETLKEGLL